MSSKSNVNVPNKGVNTMDKSSANSAKPTIQDFLNPHNYQGAKALWLMDAISDVQSLDDRITEPDLEALEDLYNQQFTPWEAADMYVEDYNWNVANNS